MGDHSHSLVLHAHCHGTLSNAKDTQLQLTSRQLECGFIQFYELAHSPCPRTDADRMPQPSCSLPWRGCKGP